MNKKHIIILGTLILLLVIIYGGATYYNENKEQSLDLELDTESEIAENKMISFTNNYPSNFVEFSYFISFCESRVIDLEDQETKELYCSITQKPYLLLNEQFRTVPEGYDYDQLSNLDELFYMPLFSLLRQKSLFNASTYTGISVDFKDVLQKNNKSLLETENSVYFCSVINPSFLDLFSTQFEYSLADSINPIILQFEEGDIYCKQFDLIDEHCVQTFAGFIPNSESISIKTYFIDAEKQIVPNIIESLHNKSFLEIMEVLNNYSLIWQMDKTINFEIIN